MSSRPAPPPIKLQATRSPEQGRIKIAEAQICQPNTATMSAGLSWKNRLQAASRESADRTNAGGHRSGRHDLRGRAGRPRSVWTENHVDSFDFSFAVNVNVVLAVEKKKKKPTLSVRRRVALKVELEFRLLQTSWGPLDLGPVFIMPVVVLQGCRPPVIITPPFRLQGQARC